MPGRLHQLVILHVHTNAGRAERHHLRDSKRQTGDPGSVVYDTSSTSYNGSTTFPEPDVFLNASVNVGSINLDVQNLTAKINLDAEVRELLSFSAGVTAHIDRVQLVIQNISAYVHLEARLENLVLMINDVLDSVDINPLIATLGNDLGNVVNQTAGGLTCGRSCGGNVTKRSINEFPLSENILYSINDYSGNTHTNRILFPNGDIVDEELDNDGDVHSQKVIGTYASEMSFNGFNQSVLVGGEYLNELEYNYAPIPGLSIVIAVFQDLSGKVVKATILAEARGGGYSSID
ncbi:hypothetical protein EJ08DRAFT_670027 [Tothia fuscella]|uniref:Uncharacterized protein n=1 Tax=Tothia fuscella TaxID=1048955 RepID=A0A9P4NSM8_9PEZI|nr:hypothetical protein EJ08DRAFT_670027 [Tothia fuscella]